MQLHVRLLNKKDFKVVNDLLMTYQDKMRLFAGCQQLKYDVSTLSRYAYEDFLKISNEDESGSTEMAYSLITS